MNGGPTGDLEGEDLIEIVHRVEEELRPLEVKGDVQRRDLKVVDHDAVRAPRSQLLVGGHLPGEERVRCVNFSQFAYGCVIFRYHRPIDLEVWGRCFVHVTLQNLGLNRYTSRS